MKKIIPAVLALTLVLMLFCAACGSTGSASVSATMPPVATEEPTVELEETPEPTAEPEDAEAVEEGEETEEEQEPEEAAEPAEAETETVTQTQTQTQTQTEPAGEPEQEEEESIDPKSVAQSLTGANVNDLYAAIGSPNSTNYAESCLVPGGEDGMLYYDGFMVETVRYADGTEIVFGVF